MGKRKQNESESTICHEWVVIYLCYQFEYETNRTTLIEHGDMDKRMMKERMMKSFLLCVDWLTHRRWETLTGQSRFSLHLSLSPPLYIMGTKCPNKDGNIGNSRPCGDIFWKTAYKSYQVMFFFENVKLQKVFCNGQV